MHFGPIACAVRSPLYVRNWFYYQANGPLKGECFSTPVELMPVNCPCMLSGVQFMAMDIEKDN